MCVFLILGVKREDQRKIVIARFGCGGLAEQDRMVSVNHIQLELGNQLIYKRGNGYCGSKIPGKRQAGITKDKRFGIFVGVFLGKDKYVMSHRRKRFPEDLHRANNTVHHGQTIICEKSNVHGCHLMYLYGGTSVDERSL